MSNQEKKPLTEPELVAQRKKGAIGVAEFEEKLLKCKGGFAGYWRVLKPLLKKQRTIRNRLLAPLASSLGIKEAKSKDEKVNETRGILRKFVEWGLLVDFKIDGHVEYFSNLPGFYASQELFDRIPDDEKEVITDILAKEPQDLETLAGKLQKVIGENLLATLLSHYVSKGLVSGSKAGYCVTDRGVEFGIDAQSVRTLDAIALENELFVKRELKDPLPASLKQVEKFLEEDIAKKSIDPVTVAESRPDSLNLRFYCEPLFGNQFTDAKLINWLLDQEKNFDVVVATGLIQGTYDGYRVDKRRVLADEGRLNRIAPQFKAADLFLSRVEEKTKKLFVLQGDDDWDLAHNYAHLQQLAEGKVWNHGVSSTLSSELSRRLMITEFYHKWKLQWETMIAYQYRIGRSLLNKREVFERIGVRKSEYRLIVEILVARRNNFAYPKSYEKVVDVEALFGNKKNRHVSPNTLRLMVGDREIQIVHNVAFSNITQYVDSLQTLEMAVRNLGARGRKLPWIIADCHQERFYATYLQGTWMMNLPGLQNALPAASHQMHEFNIRVLQSKSHRQNTFRKEPTTPGVVDIEALADGRVRFRLMNNAIRQVIEAHKGKPEIRESMCYLGDTQHGSITMQPEYEVKFMDYCLYDRKASRLYENGDVIHGFIYPQHVAENRPYRLVSVDSQQRFTIMIQMPLITQAPNLRDFAAWLGNHCWNIWGNSITGENALYFLEAHLQGFLKGQELSGHRTSALQRAMTVSRVRFAKTHNPQADPINWPYFADTIAGYKVAISHMWQPFHGGRTPVDEPRRWLRNMATACGDIHMMIGGDKHSCWMAQEAEKWLLQAPASAGQSGYELARGLMSTVMYVYLEFSTKDGIMVEFVPWQFLDGYKCQSPFYKGKDEELRRPKQGTLDYKYGKMSPFMEGCIDQLTQYLEV